MKNTLFAGFLMALFLCVGLVNATAVVSVSSPSNNTYTTDTSPTITATCYGDSDDGNITLIGNFTGAWIDNSTLLYTNNTAQSFTVSPVLGDGVYVFAVKCNDTDSENTTIGNYTITIDATVPACAYASTNPSDNAKITDGTSQTFTATITETHLDFCYFYYNGVRYNVTNSSTTCSYTFTPLRDGTYYFTANDEAGSSGSCSQRQLFITNPNGDVPEEIVGVTPDEGTEPATSGNFVIDFFANIFNNIARFFSSLFGG